MGKNSPKAEMNSYPIGWRRMESGSQIKRQLDATMCRFCFCRVTLRVSGAWRPKHVEWLCRNKICTVLHQVGVLFDLYYDARKHKSKMESRMENWRFLHYYTENILYVHFILLNWKYANKVFTILVPNFQSLFKVSLLFFSSWPLSVC